MKAQCAICQELFVETDTVVAPQCGHTFHSHCVFQWLEGSSKSCPQCRLKTNANKLLRIYFSVTHDVTDTIDPAVLQQKVDTLSLNLIEVGKEKAEILKENTALKKKVNKAHKEVQEKDKLIAEQQTQLSFLNKQQRDFEFVRRQARDSQEKLKTLEGLQKLLSSTEKEVSEELEASGDGSETAKRLITYCTVLKRELTAASSSKSLIQEQLRKTRKELGAARAELQQHENALKEKNEALRILEEDVNRLQSENVKLQTKMENLQKAIISPSGDVKNSVINRLIQESPAPAALKRPRLTDPLVDDILTSTPKITSKLTQQKPGDLINDSFDIKYQRFRPKVFGESSNAFGYDGFGGHSKPDVFPVSKIGKTKITAKASKSSLKATTLKINGKIQKATLENFFTLS